MPAQSRSESSMSSFGDEPMSSDDNPHAPQGRIVNGFYDQSLDSDSDEEYNRWDDAAEEVARERRRKTPHAVRRLREGLETSLQCALEIIDAAPAIIAGRYTGPLPPRPPPSPKYPNFYEQVEEDLLRQHRRRPSIDWSTPTPELHFDVEKVWAGLSDVIVQVIFAWEQVRDPDAGCRGCINLLHMLCTVNLVALSKNKAYRGALSRDEAKAVYICLRMFTELSNVTSADLKVLEHTASDFDGTLPSQPMVMLRFAQMSLDPNTTHLDLSSLHNPSFGEQGTVTPIDWEKAAEMVGLDLMRVEAISMRDNNLKDPYAFCFDGLPNLKHINVSDNPDFPFVPIAWLARRDFQTVTANKTGAIRYDHQMHHTYTDFVFKNTKGYDTYVPMAARDKHHCWKKCNVSTIKGKGPSYFHLLKLARTNATQLVKIQDLTAPRSQTTTSSSRGARRLLDSALQAFFRGVRAYTYGDAADKRFPPMEVLEDYTATLPTLLAQLVLSAGECEICGSLRLVRRAQPVDQWPPPSMGSVSGTQVPFERVDKQYAVVLESTDYMSERYQYMGLMVCGELCWECEAVLDKEERERANHVPSGGGFRF